MIYEFSFTEVLLSIIAIVSSVIGLISILKLLFKGNRFLNLDVFEFRRTFLLIGFVFGLILVFVIFNWTTINHNKTVFSIDALEEIVEIDIPITQHKKKELPKPPPPIIDLVPEDEIIDDQPEFLTIDTDIDEMVESPIEDLPVMENSNLPIPKTNELADIPFQIVEQMPRFPGCENESTESERKLCSDQKLMQYIYGKLRYPILAKENNIEGRIHIRFVVNKLGTVQNVEILRDIGGGCGEAAAKVVKSMKNLKWTPGKQGGRKVSVYYNLPVSFQLK